MLGIKKILQSTNLLAVPLTVIMKLRKIPNVSISKSFKTKSLEVNSKKESCN